MSTHPETQSIEETALAILRTEQLRNNHPEQFSSPVTRGEMKYKSVCGVVSLMTDEERAKEEEEKEEKGKKEKGEKEKGEKGKGGKKEEGEKEKGETKTDEEGANRKRTHSEISSPAPGYHPSDAIVTIQLISSPCECKRPTKAPKLMSIALEGVREKKDSPKLSPCNFCLMSPCIVIVEKHALQNPGKGTNKQKRFELYSFFARVLKYRARQKLPFCVTEAIKAELPDQEYVGFQ
jgi:hypothetical protein